MDKQQIVVFERNVQSTELFDLLNEYIEDGYIIRSITLASDFHGFEQADYIVILERRADNV